MGSQADAAADVVRRVRELALDGLAALPEVSPALVVDRGRSARPSEAAELDGVLGGHHVAPGPVEAVAQSRENSLVETWWDERADFRLDREPRPTKIGQ